MSRTQTLSIAHFERLYAAKDDPWRYASSAYERDKYAATLAALPCERYARGLDVGCSIGVLTAQLAERCDDLLAIEPVQAALDQARHRNAGLPHVRFASLFVPAQWPEEVFDLILISEVLDYLGDPDLAMLAERIGPALASGGDLVLVHWVGKKGLRSDGTEATDRLLRAATDVLTPLRSERNPDYRLDVLRRA